MARGEFLRRILVPLVSDRLPGLDDYAAERFRSMCERYRLARPAEIARPAAKRRARRVRKG
jgi:hypothetical protein